MVQVIEGIEGFFLKTSENETSQRLKPKEPSNLSKCFKSISRI